MNRDDFFANTKIKTKILEIEDFGTVRIKKLSVADIEALRKDYSKPEAQSEGINFVVTRAVVDENGHRLFGDDDRNKLVDVAFDAVNQIATAALEYSGVGSAPPKADSHA